MEALRWAVVDQLKNPHPDFADAIRAHLSACRHEIDTYYSAFYRNPTPGMTVDYSSQIEQVTLLLEEFHQLLEKTD